MIIWGVLGACLAVAGVVVLFAVGAGALTQAPAAHSSTGLWTRAVDKLRGTNPRTWVFLLVAVVLAGGAALWTGWPVMVVIMPVAVIGIPALLRAPPARDIELLESLDRWVRGLAATMGAGRSIADAVRASARNPPERLKDTLIRMVQRLDDRWSAPAAFLRMADELDSPDADAVLASLILATQRGGQGAVTTLAALADSIQERLKVMREIEAERAKPRYVVRQVTLITVVVLGAALVFARDFFRPYGTPTGQAVLIALVALYAGSLLQLKRMTIPRHRARILRSQA